jgi:Tol biopolymer transport system component
MVDEPGMSWESKPLFPRTHRIALSSRDDIVAAVCYKIIVLDLHTKKRIAVYSPLRNTSNLCFNPDGSILAVKNTHGQIATTDPYTGRVRRHFPNYEFGDGSNIAYSPCGGYIMTVTGLSDLRMLDAESGATMQSWQFPDEFVRCISHSSDRQKWCLLHSGIWRNSDTPRPPRYVSIWNWATKTYRKIFLSIDSVSTALISPTGKHIILTGVNYRPFSELYQIINMDGDVVATGSGPDRFRLCWSQDETLLSIADGNKCEIFTYPEMKTVRIFRSRDNYDIAFSADNSFVVRAADDTGFIDLLLKTPGSGVH